MHYKIIDEFCGEANRLFKHCLVGWSWDYCPEKTKGADNKYNHQMIHKLYSFQESGYSNVYTDILPIINAIDKHSQIAAFRRIKANLQLIQPERVYSGFHHDYGVDDEGDSNMWVGIYYLNTNDGYTELEDGTIINSVQDRMLFFNSKLKHRGVSQLDTKERVVINFNFYCPSWTNPIDLMYVPKGG